MCSQLLATKPMLLQPVPTVAAAAAVQCFRYCPRPTFPRVSRTVERSGAVQGLTVSCHFTLISSSSLEPWGPSAWHRQWGSARQQPPASVQIGLPIMRVCVNGLTPAGPEKTRENADCRSGAVGGVLLPVLAGRPVARGKLLPALRVRVGV